LNKWTASIRWEFGIPYLIAHGTDGYCVHLDRESYRCTVWEQRLVPCLGFDCGDSKRWNVWTDFEEMVINEESMEQIEEREGIYLYRIIKE
jgi:hypothetical protein